MTTPVRPTDRVRDVIARDSRLIDVFVAHSSHFEKLRNPVLRRVVAGVVTVEQAAGIAGVAPGTLVAALNAQLGVTTPAPDATQEMPPSAPQTTAAVHPAGRIVREVDVREDLRAGREPFGRIMTAARTLGDEVLRVRAPFEPVPLVGVLGQRGLTCESERHADDDWSLWAWRTAPAPVVEAAPTPATGAQVEARADQLWLDVRGLEPPEPMARTLVALETLPPGVTLVQLNVRIPQFLLPVLDERGFTYEIDDTRPDGVLVRIRRGS